MYAIYMLSDWVEHWASEAGKILAGDAIHKSDKKMCQVIIVLPTISHTVKKSECTECRCIILNPFLLTAFNATAHQQLAGTKHNVNETCSIHII